MLCISTNSQIRVTTPWDKSRPKQHTINLIPTPCSHSLLWLPSMKPNFAMLCAGQTGNCADGWGLRVLGSSGLRVYGAGLCCFLDKYSKVTFKILLIPGLTVNKGQLAPTLATAKLLRHLLSASTRQVTSMSTTSTPLVPH